MHQLSSAEICVKTGWEIIINLCLPVCLVKFSWKFAEFVIFLHKKAATHWRAIFFDGSLVTFDPSVFHSLPLVAIRVNYLLLNYYHAH